MPPRRQQTDPPGQDSFLDIVANLVGILIILVMIVGFRTRAAMEQTSIATVDVEDAPDVDAARRAASSIEADVHQVENKIKRQQMEVNYRRLERDKMLLAVTRMEADISDKRAALDDNRRNRFDRQQELSQVQFELAKFSQMRDTLINEPEPTHVIRHQPTPMAKTVFGKEVHFRLSKGKIQYVPFEELAERFKQEAQRNAWKLKDAEKITETVSPIRDFYLRYTLVKTQHQVQTRTGIAWQNRVELDFLEMIPTNEDAAESIDVALNSPNSEFRSVLSHYEPNRATITVWTHPDSFDEFRQLKEKIYGEGYLTAARPLPEGVHIRAAPRGTHSAAQ